MHDDLVTRLREEAECPDNYPEDSNLMREAADAIEELQKAVNFHKFNSEFWEDKYNSLADEKWIPVTERLPEDKERVLIFYWLCTKPKIPWYKVATFATKLCDVGEYGLYGKDHPGFYGSDSEYGYYEYTDIEYWMPLPEPPDHIGEATEMVGKESES